MGAHLVGGTFQSDKYPTCPPGKVPLSVKDPKAQPYLWAYAQDHRSVDAEFSDDLETALRAAGYVPRDQAAAASSMATVVTRTIATRPLECACGRQLPIALALTPGIAPLHCGCGRTYGPPGVDLPQLLVRVDGIERRLKETEARLQNALGASLPVGSGG